jgi:hypothetical protein
MIGNVKKKIQCKFFLQGLRIKYKKKERQNEKKKERNNRVGFNLFDFLGGYKRGLNRMRGLAWISFTFLWITMRMGFYKEK